LVNNINSSELSGRSLNPERILANADLVQNYAKLRDKPSSTFWDAIQSLQHPDIAIKRNSHATKLVFFEKNSEFGPALAELMGSKELDEFATLSETLREQISEEFARSLQMYSTLLPKTYAAFSRTIAFVIVGKKNGYGGGTISNRLGLIWLSPSPEWTSNQWIENVVHEFVHSCLFLEDMVNTIFTDGAKRLDKEDALALSAIRCVKRGYDKSLHSAFVSLAIVELQLMLGNLNRATELVDPLILCLDDLSSKTRFLTENGRDLFKDLIENTLNVRDKLLPMTQYV